MDKSTLAERVIRLLVSGDLPTAVPERCVGGRGSGGHCAVCRARIAPFDVEVEIADHLVLHPDCYLVWVATVRRLAA